MTGASALPVPAGLSVPWWLVGLLVVAAVPLGWWLGRALDTGGYRLDDEWPDGAAPTGGAAAGSFPAIWRWAAALALPALWGLLAWRLGALADGAGLPPYLLLAWLAVALTWTDLDTHRLPEGLTLPAIPGTAGAAPDSGRNAPATGARWDARCSAPSWSTSCTSRSRGPARRAFGMGDVTLAGLVALPLGFLGWVSVFEGLFVAHVVGGLVSVVVVVARRGGRTTEIPFGPFLLVGALVAALVDLRRSRPAEMAAWKDRAHAALADRGECHGPALVAVIEGLPAGVEVTSSDVAAALARRRLGYGRGARMVVREGRGRVPRRASARADPRLTPGDPDRQHRVAQVGDGDESGPRRGVGVRRLRRRQRGEGDRPQPPADPTAAGACGPRRDAEVRLRGRAAGPGAGLGA